MPMVRYFHRLADLELPNAHANAGLLFDHFTYTLAARSCIECGFNGFVVTSKYIY